VRFRWLKGFLTAHDGWQPHPPEIIGVASGGKTTVL
jgi:hypothetical protein